MTTHEIGPFTTKNGIIVNTMSRNAIEHPAILIDDNDDVRASFLKSTRGQERQAIDAKRNVIEQLINMLVA